ncbi:hypothetical protein B0T17DRAFT_611426 [Bombardia bombarda]|uniref:Uncharacterized protein n=1 Tax=Bombardia bombarda TaxID=252184 RepID=A0AA39XI29_9PEZI|nr:hypothetical protein B0T17DRAFT_611426 [Bombardia bombarda]
MLSHLRFHRRASPGHHDQLSPWEAAPLHEHPQTAQDVSPRPDVRPRSSNSSQLPPMLPPITRVTSADFALASIKPQDDARPASQDSRPPQTRPAFNGGTTGFIGGVALQNQRRSLQGTQPEAAGALPGQIPPGRISRAKSPPPPINTTFPSRPHPTTTKQLKPPSSFVAPTELQQNSAGSTSRRPAGTRMATEPAPFTASPTASDTHKGKRGLPFLKNPMSTLLMRRRTGQSTPDVQPPPSSTYDPRIRGTKVHDFSAPRPKRVLSTVDASAASETPQSVGDSASTPRGAIWPPRLDSAGQGNTELARNPSLNHSSVGSDLGLSSQQDHQYFVSKPLPEQPIPAVPPKDSPATSHRTSSSATSRAISRQTSILLDSTNSTRTTRSHRLSLSETSTRGSVISSLPKHMASTSSRFSFDMIGSANEEKLLEDRHRKREQEKKTTDVAPDRRDSRFDEFDEDSFDYDAMMDDDGLEERIPGVNADYEDEEEGDGEDGNEYQSDPDNDQENFAGFVFQRSNQPSAAPSPYPPGELLPTPRDANGTVIGFAMTKDTTPCLPPHDLYLDDAPEVGLDTTLVHSNSAASAGSVPGLGIQGFDITAEAENNAVAPQNNHQDVPPDLPPPQRTVADDIYFDDGLADELNFEHDGTVFDESIFDNVDTDKYGRPIPGAFARAKEAMQAMHATQIQDSKRDSDITSRFSAASELSQSTAHTSLSTGLQQPPPPDVEIDQGNLLSAEQAVVDDMPKMGILGQDLAYQAALAEAAQMAAASGKFRRGSSPPPPAELTITSPTDSTESQTHSHPDPTLDHYEDDPYTENLGDYDVDDEDIVAEANASALANDSDGFYGQEFGFYSTPISQSHHGYSHHTPSPSGVPVALNAENLFQYANGGYFGPGLDRTTSGRIVSREPNLTPITERSEYSNRNSIMSLTIPPVIGSEGGRNSANLQSPGLAQLALLSDDDSMNLSALLKLRSKAWGGSQASLVSSREGSPREERGAPLDGASSPFNSSGLFGPPLAGQQQHTRKNSAFSIWTNSDAGDSGQGSPTLTTSMILPPFSSQQQPPMPPLVPVIQPANGNSQAVLLPPVQIFSPPKPTPLVPPAAHVCSNNCSPVLEGEECDGSAGCTATTTPCATGLQQPSAGGGLWTKSPTQMDAGSDIFGSESIMAEVASSAAAAAAPMAPAGGIPSPQQQRHGRPGMGHRHKGSADSISYIKEEESGGTRWVMERRRTAESGEVEILEREVVEGGRI